MTIEYALTRMEIAGSFWRSFRHSLRFRGTILFYASVLSFWALIISGALSKPFAVSDVYIVILTALGFFLLMPVMLALRGKTSRRSLTVSPEGIATEIGSITAQVPWTKIKTIRETDQFILIAGLSGNAFFVPLRAFSNAEHKAEFVSKMKSWAFQDKVASI